MTVGDKPLWAECPACGHAWAVCYLPMEVTAACRLVLEHANCPKCTTPGVVARQNDGVLLEHKA